MHPTSPWRYQMKIGEYPTRVVDMDKIISLLYIKFDRELICIHEIFSQFWIAKFYFSFIVHLNKGFVWVSFLSEFWSVTDRTLTKMI